MNEERALQLATYAHSLLQHELFHGIVEEVTKSLMAEWASSDPKESSTRDIAYYTLQGLGAFVGQVGTLAQLHEMQVEEAERINEGD